MAFPVLLKKTGIRAFESIFIVRHGEQYFELERAEWR